MAPDAFDELLAALNPYADELVYQPTFHLFTKLPVELRCRIYDEYFLDENRAISCHGWPHLKFSKPYVKSIRNIRKSAPFLPNLCLTSKELQEEILSCLLEAAHFEFFNDPMRLCAMRLSLHSTSLGLARKVRKTTLKNTNGMHKRLVFQFDPDPYQVAQASVQFLNTIKLFLPHLRELAVTFYAPFIYTDMASVQVQGMNSLQAFSDEDYLGGFQHNSILNLRELQKLSITGIKDYYDRNERRTRFDDAVIGDVKADSLVAISDLCRKIKKDFTRQGQDVRVTACLQYAPNKYTEEVFK
jgi:hypothetical protein